MNHFAQMIEIGNHNLEQLRTEASIAALQTKPISLRRRIARVLKSVAQIIDHQPTLARV